MEISHIKNSHVNTHDDFIAMCMAILPTQSFNVRKIDENSAQTSSEAIFDKTFKKSLRQIIFGPKRIVFSGKLVALFDQQNQTEISFSGECRHFVSENRFEVCNKRNCGCDIDSSAIVNAIQSWRPE